MSTPDLKTIDMSRLTDESQHSAEVADLLRSAARIAERIEEGCYPEERIDSVAWRAADALLLIREYVNKRRLEGDDPTPGIHEPTKRGARLASGGKDASR